MRVALPAFTCYHALLPSTAADPAPEAGFAEPHRTMRAARRACSAMQFAMRLHGASGNPVTVVVWWRSSPDLVEGRSTQCRICAGRQRFDLSPVSAHARVRHAWMDGARIFTCPAAHAQSIYTHVQVRRPVPRICLPATGCISYTYSYKHLPIQFLRGRSGGGGV